jgi:glycosyltransferase involved in cell wall biosynthesis
MATVLHVIQHLSLGGGARAALAAAKYSSKSGDFQHAIISLQPPEEAALVLAKECGVRVLHTADWQEYLEDLRNADIVQLEWWNSPDMYEFLMRPLPPLRLAAWLHVGGHLAPQVVPQALVQFVDKAIACSPHTFRCPALAALTPEERQRKAGLAYGAADFQRVAGVTKRPHAGFNVGYIGTVHFLKMHPDFVAMSSAAQVPDIRFIVCGSGGAEETLKQQAAALNVSERFDIRGYVSNIRPVLEELDVYGYPLCPDTYAAAEVNLQEVMYAGIPPVVFPYGGVRDLVVNDFTGLLVNSAHEYKQAIEYLFHNPAERARLGENAATYASQIFGAEIAAKRLNSYYTELLRMQKHERQWQAPIAINPNAPTRGSEIFITGLAGQFPEFAVSRFGNNFLDLLNADQAIVQTGELMRSNGIMAYARVYPNDPYLMFWVGLTLQNLNLHDHALNCFLQAMQLGLPFERACWSIATSAAHLGRLDIATQALQKTLELAPNYAPAQALLASIQANGARL